MSTLKRRIELIRRLENYGFSYEESNQLRRIEMTLSRWGELECGYSNEYASWALTRGRKVIRHGQHANGHGAHCTFVHDDDGQPFIERRSHTSNEVRYTRIPDREKGALKRLEAIVKARNVRERRRREEESHTGTVTDNDVVSYHQGDPRGCCLYIVRKSDLNGSDINSTYTRGVAVCD